MNCATPDNPKRKKSELSPDFNSPDQIDLKKAKRLLSISETESELENMSESEEEKAMEKGKPQAQIISPEDELFAKIEASMQENLKIFKKELMNDIKMTLGDKIAKEVKESLGKSITELKEEFCIMDQEINGLKAEVKDMKQEQKIDKEKLKTLENTVQNLQDKIVKNEQYSRRCNVRIFGVMEEKEENVKEVVCKLFKEKMGMTAHDYGYVATNIETAHRIDVRPGKARVNGARPIIVKFTNVDMKLDIMKARKTLKGSGIYINEDLTAEIHKLFNRVRNHRIIDQAWTWNGTVFGKNYEGEIHKVPYGKKVEEIF